MTLLAPPLLMVLHYRVISTGRASPFCGGGAFVVTVLLPPSTPGAGAASSCAGIATSLLILLLPSGYVSTGGASPHHSQFDLCCSMVLSLLSTLVLVLPLAALVPPSLLILLLSPVTLSSAGGANPISRGLTFVCRWCCRCCPRRVPVPPLAALVPPSVDDFVAVTVSLIRTGRACAIGECVAPCCRWSCCLPSSFGAGSPPPVALLSPVLLMSLPVAGHVCTGGAWHLSAVLLPPLLMVLSLLVHVSAGAARWRRRYHRCCWMSVTMSAGHVGSPGEPAPSAVFCRRYQPCCRLRPRRRRKPLVAPLSLVLLMSLPVAGHVGNWWSLHRLAVFCRRC